ncbi:MAG: lytic transglycosylase domain-containing protein [Thermosulfidibacteraceae bacterium]
MRTIISRLLILFLFLFLVCFGKISFSEELTKAERLSLLGLCNLAVSEANNTKDNGIKLYAIYCLIGSGLVDDAYKILDSINDEEVKKVAETLFRKVEVAFTVVGKPAKREELLNKVKEAFYLQDYDRFFELVKNLENSGTKRKYVALTYYRLGRWKEFLEFTRGTNDSVLLYYRIKVKRLLGISKIDELEKLKNGGEDFYFLIMNWDKYTNCNRSFHDNLANNSILKEECLKLLALQNAGLDEKSKEFVYDCVENNLDFIYRMKNPYWAIRVLYLLKLPKDYVDKYSHLRIENKYVRFYAHLYNVEEDFIYAIMRQESLFNRFARSFADARGLMQMIPKTALWISENLKDNKSGRKLYIPFFSIRYGSWYLSHLAGRFNFPQVIVAYNKGPTRLSNWMKENEWINDAVDLAEFFPVEEAREYLKKVMVNYYNYRCKY